MTLKRWEPAATVNAPHAQIEYVVRGVDHRRDSVDVVDVPFETVDKVRTPKSWKHKKNYTGQYWAATTGGHVWFESLYERVALMQMDRDPAVAAISSQPMWIDWAGTPRRHAPDFFVRFCNGSAAVIDVKPLLRIKPDDVEAFDWTSALCGELGWDYFVVHDISESEGRNLRFLSGYRYDRWRDSASVDVMRAHSGESARLSEWASLLEGVSAQPLGAVYSALWWRDLIFDSSRRLSLTTVAKAA
ncbi:TnsA-like heteromeric transposase endonuclease subunit [Microbacterium aurum]|uniref:TnsA-like heteromeric transposase endonuclease subunit n=1 Tax=uncultured Microbacterium sp. TaxID=191216 RepID=UPI000DB5935C|nr:TnsA-like heteromeric transposase endonuclease subunit [uncultured Microbacterium sp.]PZU45127.1 MAG: transposase [Microbacterium sp.]